MFQIHEHMTRDEVLSVFHVNHDSGNKTSYLNRELT